MKTLSYSEARRAIGQLEEQQTVAQMFEMSQSGISRPWNSFLETRHDWRRPEQGRPTSTTPKDNRSRRIWLAKIEILRLRFTI